MTNTGDPSKHAGGTQMCCYSIKISLFYSVWKSRCKEDDENNGIIKSSVGRRSRSHAFKCACFVFFFLSFSSSLMALFSYFHSIFSCRSEVPASHSLRPLHCIANGAKVYWKNTTNSPVKSHTTTFTCTRVVRNVLKEPSTRQRQLD